MLFLQCTRRTTGEVRRELRACAGPRASCCKESTTDQGFEIPEDSRVRNALEGSFGPHLQDADGPHDIVVEFSAEKARLVSSRAWHPTQQVTKLPDGRVRLQFRVANLVPLISWILEWGPHARAVAPTALVDQVKLELRAALAQY